MRDQRVSFRPSSGAHGCGASGRERQDDSRERNPVNWILRPNELHERSLRLPFCVVVLLRATVVCFFSLALSLFLPVSYPLDLCCPSLFVLSLESLPIPQLSLKLTSTTRRANCQRSQRGEYAHSTSYLPSSARPSHFLFIQRSPKTLRWAPSSKRSA
jgi:hypothetical protein